MITLGWVLYSGFVICILFLTMVYIWNVQINWRVMLSEVTVENIQRNIGNLLNSFVMLELGYFHNIFGSMLLFLLVFIWLMNSTGVLFLCSSFSSYFVFSVGVSLMIWHSLAIYWEYKLFNYMSLMHYSHVPDSLFVVVFFIEALSYSMRMFSLGVRLSANIIVGHVLIHFCYTFVLFCLLENIFIGFVVLSLVSFMFILILELMVGVVQTYIFVLLSLMYLNVYLNLIIVDLKCFVISSYYIGLYVVYWFVLCSSFNQISDKSLSGISLISDIEKVDLNNNIVYLEIPMVNNYNNNRMSTEVYDYDFLYSFISDNECISGLMNNSEFISEWFLVCESSCLGYGLLEGNLLEENQFLEEVDLEIDLNKLGWNLSMYMCDSSVVSSELNNVANLGEVEINENHAGSIEENVEVINVKESVIGKFNNNEEDGDELVWVVWWSMYLGFFMLFLFSEFWEPWLLDDADELMIVWLNILCDLLQCFDSYGMFLVCEYCMELNMGLQYICLLDMCVFLENCFLPYLNSLWILLVRDLFIWSLIWNADYLYNFIDTLTVWNILYMILSYYDYRGLDESAAEYVVVNFLAWLGLFLVLLCLYIMLYLIWSFFFTCYFIFCMYCFSGGVFDVLCIFMVILIIVEFINWLNCDGIGSLSMQYCSFYKNLNKEFEDYSSDGLYLGVFVNVLAFLYCIVLLFYIVLPFFVLWLLYECNIIYCLIFIVKMLLLFDFLLCVTVYVVNFWEDTVRDLGWNSGNSLPENVDGDDNGKDISDFKFNINKEGGVNNSGLNVYCVSEFVCYEWNISCSYEFKLVYNLISFMECIFFKSSGIFGCDLLSNVYNSLFVWFFFLLYWFNF